MFYPFRGLLPLSYLGNEPRRRHAGECCFSIIGEPSEGGPRCDRDQGLSVAEDGRVIVTDPLEHRRGPCDTRVGD